MSAGKFLFFIKHKPRLKVRLFKRLGNFGVPYNNSGRILNQYEFSRVNFFYKTIHTPKKLAKLTKNSDPKKPEPGLEGERVHVRHLRVTQISST